MALRSSFEYLSYGLLGIFVLGLARIFAPELVDALRASARNWLLSFVPR